MNRPEDRRKYPRLRREERAVIRRMETQSDNPAGDVLYCKTVDISPAGMQARAKQQLQPGELVDVVISIEGYRDSFHMHGQTRWCRPAEDAEEFCLASNCWHPKTAIWPCGGAFSIRTHLKIF